jgi:hypothetical protein
MLRRAKAFEVIMSYSIISAPRNTTKVETIKHNRDPSFYADQSNE